MMSKERLKKIKEKFNFERLGRFIDAKPVSPYDLKWLIEQVELFHQAKDKHALIKSNIALNKKVQELEEFKRSAEQLYKNYHLSAKKSVAEKEELREQNKRYRETLETLFHKALVFAGHEDLDVHNPELFQFASAVSFSSQQALEGEEK